jgi:hypothetical protein
MQLTFKDWGKPRRILFYQEELTPQGGRFELFREPQHTDEDVNKAKNWLRHNHDVVGIKVVQALV